MALLKQLTQAAEDFSFLLSATLVGEDGRPRTEHGQRPAELLAGLAEQGDSIYRKYHSLEDDVHTQPRHKRPAGNKKGGISAATFYASRYTAHAALFGICTDVRPEPAGRRLRELLLAVRPFSSRAKYCERVLDPETGASCKGIAAKLAYAEELKADKAKELYNKMRNRHQMRCARAPATRKCATTTTPGASRCRWR